MGKTDNDYERALRHSQDRKRKAALARARRAKEIRCRLVIGVLAIVALIVAAVAIVKLSNIKSGSKEDSVFATIVRNNETTQTSDENVPQKTTQEEHKYKYPYAAKASDYIEFNDDKIYSTYISLLDADNHKIIAGKNADTKMYPASMTKVMTLIIAVEQLDNLEATFTFSDELIYPLIIEEASRAGFEGGEVVKVRDMLYGLILPSGADAAEALAIMVGGSQQGFVELMNLKCKELGLKNTHFANPTGLHDEQQYSTASEIAMIMDYAMKNEICKMVLSTYQYTTQPTNVHPNGIPLTSTMFSRIYGDEAPGITVIGGKTGYVYEAGNCLVSLAMTDDGRTYVLCTGDSKNKWHTIYDEIYIYGTYVPKNQVVDDN